MTERSLPFPKAGDTVTATRAQLTSLGSNTPVVRIVLNRNGLEKFWEAIDPDRKCGYIVFVEGKIPVNGEFTLELTRVTTTCGFARVSR